jgi:hypothetical protein
MFYHILKNTSFFIFHVECRKLFLADRLFHSHRLPVNIAMFLIMHKPKLFTSFSLNPNIFMSTSYSTF